MRARNPSLQKPFLATALFGVVASAAGGAQAAPGRLPGSRPVDPVVKRADGTCWQAVDPCPAGVCAPDAATRQVRCPLPAVGDAGLVGHRSVRPDGVCTVYVSPRCPPPDCPDGPDKPCRPRMTCNPPPPRPVPCEGEGDARQIVVETAPPSAPPPPPPSSAPASAPASTPEPEPIIERADDGTCWVHPRLPADFRCPEGAMCNPPAPRMVECPPNLRR